MNTVEALSQDNPNSKATDTAPAVAGWLFHPEKVVEPGPTFAQRLAAEPQWVGPPAEQTPQDDDL